MWGEERFRPEAQQNVQWNFWGMNARSAGRKAAWRHSAWEGFGLIPSAKRIIWPIGLLRGNRVATTVYFPTSAFWRCANFLGWWWIKSQTSSFTSVLSSDLLSRDCRAKGDARLSYAQRWCREWLCSVLLQSENVVYLYHIQGEVWHKAKKTEVIPPSHYLLSREIVLIKYLPRQRQGN